MNYQHSAIKGAGLTLPSIEAGLGSINILRDPPKSIHTRYKPKVSDTSKITEWIDASGDRICEAIKPYARGVNPMVSVSYSNYGSNGGQVRDIGGKIGTGQAPIASCAGQAYLPYRVNREGAFRPPIIPPEQLLPLSRLPRLPTSQQTNPGADYMSQDFETLTRCVKGSDLRALRKDLLRVCAIPKAIINIETPASKPYDVGNMINNKVNTSASTNKGDVRYTLGINKNPERGIKTQANTLYGSIPVSAFKNIQATPITNCVGNQPLPIQDRVKGSYVTNISGSERTNYIHQQQVRDRNRPITSMQINPCRNGVDLNSTISSRTYTNLPARTSRGGFANMGLMPAETTDGPTYNLNNTKSVYQLAAEQQLSARNNHAFVST